MKYSDVKDFVSAGLTALGYGAGKAMPAFDPGPNTTPALLAKYTSTVVFLTVGNGIGMTTEEVFDQPFIVVRVVGTQSDYDFAEQLAKDVDDILLAVDHNAVVGTAPTLRISRSGGPPQLIDFDSGSRYHFQNTYIAETQR